MAKRNTEPKPKPKTQPLARYVVLEARCICGSALPVRQTKFDGTARTRCRGCDRRWMYSLWRVRYEAERYETFKFVAYPVDNEGRFVEDPALSLKTPRAGQR